MQSTNPNIFIRRDHGVLLSQVYIHAECMKNAKESQASRVFSVTYGLFLRAFPPSFQHLRASGYLDIVKRRPAYAEQTVWQMNSGKPISMERKSSDIGHAFGNYKAGDPVVRKRPSFNMCYAVRDNDIGYPVLHERAVANMGYAGRNLHMGKQVCPFAPCPTGQ